MRTAWAWVVLCGLAGCEPAGAVDRLRRSEATLRRAVMARDASAEVWRPGEVSPTRQSVVAAAVARDPMGRAQRARASALLAGAWAEGALPPPELEAQLWNAPLARPWQLHASEMLMLALRQSFPAAGVRSARSRAMAAEAEAAVANALDRARVVTQEVGMAWAELVGAAAHHRVHVRHLALMTTMLAVAEARYATGASGVDELLRLQAERARVLRDLTRFEGDRARATQSLNVLLHRDPEAPLGDVPEGEAERVALPLTELLARAEGARQELVAAQRRTEAAGQRVEAARAEATRPMWSAGVSYMQDPMMRPGYGLSAGMSLPWLSAVGAHRRREAEAMVRVEAAEADAAAQRVRAEVSDAYARMATRVRELEALRGGALPAAARAVEAALDAYRTTRGSLLACLDAARMTLDLRMEEADGVMALARAVNDLEAAVGAALPRVSLGAEAGR